MPLGSVTKTSTKNGVAKLKSSLEYSLDNKKHVQVWASLDRELSSQISCNTTHGTINLRKPSHNNFHSIKYSQLILMVS